MNFVPMGLRPRPYLCLPSRYLQEAASGDNHRSRLDRSTSFPLRPNPSHFDSFSKLVNVKL